MSRVKVVDARKIQNHAIAGFTLVELLVVIGIIGMLVALLLPAVMSGQEQARQTQCAKQMKDLASANLAHAMRKGRFPGWQESSSASWVVQIFPYLDMQGDSARYASTGLLLSENATKYKADANFLGYRSNSPDQTPDALTLGYGANIGNGSSGDFC